MRITRFLALLWDVSACKEGRKFQQQRWETVQGSSYSTRWFIRNSLTLAERLWLIVCGKHLETQPVFCFKLTVIGFLTTTKGL